MNETRTWIRPALWALLIVSLAANGVTSSLGVNLFIASGFGLATLACAAALAVQHYRSR
ncbi:hypothetical protein SAMN05421541_1215 [Actinoplanes philippinensis]|uniref:Uncharacterized protein n=1 Tax=Actinoplanes philippinensis TaxID=35752 RepID=A0A1I2LGX6_9ACTN|nr:hypothetical protein [Actinoplanes philippinensis]SFF76381.1 hypothetical protein SAMN05421541_1215 [Actinoplanes philippinensis]